MVARIIDANRHLMPAKSMLSYKSELAYLAFWPTALHGTGMNIARIICAGILMLAGNAAAQDGGKAIQKTTISLGTATPGGGFPLYGNAFAEVLNAADPALSIEPRNTKGSTENIPLLEADQLDIALVSGEPSYQAFMGIGRAATKLKILTAMYSSPAIFLVRTDSA